MYVLFDNDSRNWESFQLVGGRYEDTGSSYLLLGGLVWLGGFGFWVLDIVGRAAFQLC